MDDETRTFLHGAYQYLEQQQKLLNKMMIVTFALHGAVQELGPEGARLYEKHYQATLQTPIKSEGDLALQSLGQSLRRLSKPGS